MSGQSCRRFPKTPLPVVNICLSVNCMVPILVKTEATVKEGQEVKQNRFFIEGAYKYTYNNGQIAMADHKAAALNFLNALERIPKLIEQYRTQNITLERDIPTLQEIVNGTWKKEEDLKKLKSELSALERKIQITLIPKQRVQSNELDTKQKVAVTEVTVEKCARIPESTQLVRVRN